MESKIAQDLTNFDLYPDRLKKGVEFLVQIIKGLKLDDNPKILDIGTGKGKMAIVLASLGYNVLTGEPEGDNWANWQENAKLVGMLEKITFRHFHAENLPFESGRFDIVTCYGSFHHLQKRTESFSEFYRVLKPQGKLIIFDFNQEGIDDIKKHRPEHSDAIEPMNYLEDVPFNVDRIEHKKIFAEIYSKKDQ